MDKLAQIKLLDKGKGFQYLLDAAFGILQKPLVLFDTHYSMLAYAGEVADDPIWNALVTKGVHNGDTQRFFAEENLYEQFANSDKPIILKSGRLKYARMMGYIINSENIKIAILVMFEMQDSFCDEDSLLFEALSDILAEETKYDNYYTEYGRMFHEEIIRKLLDRAIKDRLVYTPQIQILYDGFAEYLYLAVVDVGQGAEAEAGAGAEAEAEAGAEASGDLRYDRIVRIRDMLRDMYKSYKFAIYTDYIVILISSKYRVAFDELFVDRFFVVFEQNNLYAGISDSFENPYEMRDHYNKAVSALIEGKKNNIAQRIYLY